MFVVNQRAKRAIAMMEALNALLPEIYKTVWLTEEVKMTRYHGNRIELTWNNGSRNIVTVLDNVALEKGIWGVDMSDGQKFNATAIHRSLSALNGIKDKAFPV